MGGFGLRLLGRRLFNRESRSERGEIAQELPPHQRTSPHRSTPLILLVPDATALHLFRLYAFDSAEAAKESVRTWFLPEAELGIIGFWALHEEPGSVTDRPWEVVVLIRDLREPGLVYPFSFVEMEAAHQFLRQEASQGLDLGLALLYNAVPVLIGFDDFGDVYVVPPYPPAPAKREIKVALRFAVEATPDAEIEGAIPPAPPEEVEAPEAWTTPAEAEGDEPLQQELRGENTPAEPITEPSRIEIALHDRRTEEPAEDRPDDARASAPPAVDVPPQRDSEPPGRERIAEEVPTKAEEAEGAPKDGEDREKRADPEDLERPDIAEVVAKVLRVKRWESREGPFQGFGSPPGKF